ncbi:copper homeostasis protein CutC [Luteimonas sp. SX5]|uniref:PF03932 family protein CutC n=1 Tax=Luteimonas galliterrae TaxID=2940486 RepID=A0ABT0MFS1_9GAMM|nr:copper homeostasis protein CutC [Luteimonas galliterrae]MCL1633719.1 copper homeostasis protein CutC [Luteimonas galliterrae]
MSAADRPLLEIAANSVASALAAQAGGADRIELCENLGEGGTTPSHGTLAVVRERLRIPVYVLIRPRGGDFLYDDAEFETMRRDIEHCVRLGCDGVVIGALDADGAIDMPRCRDLIAAAGPIGVTFHRAFDAARDQTEALQAVIALGCERVLTSGAAADALSGASNIAALAKGAGQGLRIMAGAGITADNIGLIAERSGAHEFHASARALHRSAMRFRQSGLQGLEPDRMQTDVERVRALMVALKRVPRS